MEELASGCPLKLQDPWLQLALLGTARGSL